MKSGVVTRKNWSMCNFVGEPASHFLFLHYVSYFFWESGGGAGNSDAREEAQANAISQKLNHSYMERSKNSVLKVKVSKMGLLTGYFKAMGVGGWVKRLRLRQWCIP